MSRRRDRHDHLARTPVYLPEDAKDGGHQCRACASAIVRARRHHCSDRRRRGAAATGPALSGQSVGSTSTCRRGTCAIISARRCGGISNLASTAILGTGRCRGISTSRSRSGRGRASSASWRAALASMSTTTSSRLQLPAEAALAVHFLGRHEKLEEDLNAALERAGVGRRVTLPRTNITPNKDESRHYRSYYSPGTRALVAEWYQPEIALLGYGY